MFDAPSTVAFDPTTPMLSIDLSRLGNSGDNTGHALAMTCASAWMESALADPHAGRRWVIHDEGWRVLKHIALLERMQSQWKVAGRSFVTQHLLHPSERELFDTDARMSGKVREFTNTDVVIPLNPRVMGR